MADSFLQEENPFDEEYFEQYSQQVGDNRIASIKEELKEMSDPEEMMLLIMDTLKDTEVVPDVGQYYTFIYTAKTPRLQYDQHPLVLCGNVYKWGFTAMNQHWGEVRQYSWNEVLSNVYEISEEEFQTLTNVPLAKFKST